MQRLTQIEDCGVPHRSAMPLAESDRPEYGGTKNHKMIKLNAACRLGLFLKTQPAVDFVPINQRFV